MEAINQVTLLNQGVVPSWRDVLPIHPAAELLPRMSQAELQELGEDIKNRGLVIPVTILKDDVNPAQLLDGINRLDAMELAGITIMKKGELDRDVVKCREVHGNTDPYAYCLSANLLRRHLTNEQKRDLVAKLLALKPTASDRQIGKLAHVSHPTVAAVRADMEGRGKISTSIRRTDARGRKQPAKKRTAEPAQRSKPATNTAIERKNLPVSKQSKPPRVTHINIIAAWTEAPLEERTKAIDGIGLEPLLAALPQTWIPLIEGRFTARPKTEAARS